MPGKNFQNYDVQITGECVSQSKNWKWIFLLFPHPSGQNASAGSYHHPQAVRNIKSPKQCFLKIYLSHQQKEEGGNYDVIEGKIFFYFSITVM